ncbi:MAG TPA: hypothetical protein VHP11_04390, partial [Tepidisphaeraceae bacterium]|nr:hypothetical protein [Tepidisphaeraceae bacterium]
FGNVNSSGIGLGSWSGPISPARVCLVHCLRQDSYALDEIDRSASNYDYYDYARHAYSYMHMVTHQTIWVPVWERISVLKFLQLVLAVGLGYLTLTGLILWHTARHFNLIVGRASQHRASSTVPS